MHPDNIKYYGITNILGQISKCEHLNIQKLKIICLSFENILYKKLQRQEEFQHKFDSEELFKKFLPEFDTEDSFNDDSVTYPIIIKSSPCHDALCMTYFEILEKGKRVPMLDCEWEYQDSFRARLNNDFTNVDSIMEEFHTNLLKWNSEIVQN